jgi:hypothetical protein
MPVKRVDPRRIKLHRPYTVDEAARALSVHPNTFRAWFAKGLPKLAEQRPALVLGSELRAFLEVQRKSRKQPCGPGRIFCFKCHAPRRPALGMVDYVPHGATGGNLRALCEHCGTIMHRRISRAAIAKTMPDSEIRFTGAHPRLEASAPSPVNCDKSMEAKRHG